MYAKDKLYLIAGNVDDSIKSASSVYDIRIFKSYVEFEKYVENTPIIIDTLVVTSEELPFTNTNMARLIAVENSPFVKIKSSIIYLIDGTYDIKTVNKFFSEKGLSKWSVYQSDLSPKFISEILSGERRDSDEGQVDVVIYRYRAEDYLRQQQLKKQQESSEDAYVTDEDLLSGIPDEEEPIDIVPETTDDIRVNYVVGANKVERTTLVFIIAQYLSLNSGKTLIMEKDVEYHRLSDIVIHSGIDCMMIDVEELYQDISEAIKKIIKSDKKLIVVSCYNRYNYNYNFVMDLLEVALNGNVLNVVRECDFAEAPHGKKYSLVMPNTCPDVIECCNSIKYDIDPEMVTLVGVMIGSLGPVNINSDEIQAIATQLLEKDSLKATVVKVDGVALRGKELGYDILSIIGAKYG